MAKHLFYLTNNQLTASIWDKGVLAEGRTFDHYETGWLQFSAYLDGHRELDAFLLTDLIEEDFQRENVPHVAGGARQKMLQRRLANLYRDTPYRQASQQGREPDGRRDDRMLFSALTNAELLKPWLAALKKKSVVVAGIYSVALLSTLAFQKFGLGKQAALLVTHQSSGLRQSFFQDGYLRFSRLTPMTAWTPVAIAEIAKAEMAKTQQFLASTRMLARGAPIDIVVVIDAETVRQLMPLCPDTDGMNHHYIDLNEASQLLSLKRRADLKLCDPLFLGLLGSKRVASHYATFEQTRFRTMAQTRVAFNALSVITIASGVILTAGNVLDTFHAANKARQAEFETRGAIARHQALITSMPVTVTNPHDMKSAVDLEQMISHNAPAPTMLIAAISHALDALPQIRIDEINWQVSDVDGAATDPAAAAPVPPVAAVDAAPSAALIGVPKKPFEIVTLEGEVVPFKNDYRTALESINRLTVDLRKNKHIQVDITRPPLDVRPSAKLESQAGNDEGLSKPRFSLKLAWRP
ncbi:MAG TPA: hypothetical protein DIT28_01535 [Oxalobacteraceae bacterium]|nr:hypothetical protein [Oxalobacteraceae bacterium]